MDKALSPVVGAIGPAPDRSKPVRSPLGGQGGHAVPPVGAIAPPGPLREFWIAFSANRGAVVGLWVVVALLLVALFAPLIAPHPPFQTNSAAFLRPPSWQAGGSAQFGHRPICRAVLDDDGFPILVGRSL